MGADMNNYGLREQVIMVTGGGSGIGRQIALLAAQDGAKIAVCDMNGDAATSVCDEARAMGADALPVVFNVTNGSATRDAVAEIEATLGPIFGLAVAAGISRPSRAEAIPEEVWNEVIAVNLTGAFLTCQAAGSRMIARRRGSIVTIASGDALGGHAGRAHYCASKYGLVGLTQTLSIEWGRHGVRVNAIAPGGVDTPMLRNGVPNDFIEEVMIDRTPMARLSAAPDHARVCLFLLSESAGFVNGVVLPVDGGATAGYLTRWNGADFASNAMLKSGAYDLRS
jgi:NAD(P)-dependent dehydrogenase (short-subunit alcohol dehydrogenase family)